MCFWLLSAASPIKWTHLEIMPIFKLLGMIYLQISTSVSYCSKQLCFMAPMWWVSKLWYMSPVSCYCTTVHFTPKHNILFIFFLSWTLILGNSDGWTGWSWKYLAKSMIQRFNDSMNVSGSTLHLRHSFSPGSAKLGVLPHHPQKCNFGLCETYSIIYSLQGL